jgi:hypothetical protein
MFALRNRRQGDTAVATAVRFDDVLDLLHDPDERVRERAARRLARLARNGLSMEQGIMALKASTLPYPRRRFRGDDTSVDLIRAALTVPFPEYLESIRQRFHLWNPKARKEIMARLVRIEDERAAVAIVELLREHARSRKIKSLPLGLYANVPQFADVLFPELSNYLDVPRLRVGIVDYALSFVAAHQIEGETLVPHLGTLLELYARRREQLMPSQSTDGVAWRWDYEYYRWRGQAGVLLDLFGYIPAPEVLPILREAVDKYTDPRLRMYAVLSLMRHNEDVPAVTVAEIAADPECRKLLFDGLQKVERYQLYPVKLRTQAALAESDLVNWLTHPHELGRAPDELELMRTVTFDSETDMGLVDYYLFRFHLDGEHWATKLGGMVGVAGPFVRKDAPTVQSLGDTHSQFRRWDDKTLEEHVADVRQLFTAWRERHNTSKDEA